MIPLTMVTLMAAGIARATTMATGSQAGRQAARSLFQHIDHQSAVDVASEEGLRPVSVQGALELRDVVFAYPAAAHQPVCTGLSLTIEAGKQCALVGASGSGKSTVVQLLERFYDPQQGSVLFDGVDVRLLNLRWLRRQLGLVGQEPVLFMGSVAENIAYGKPEGASEAEVEAAARAANAHEFIVTSLADGYATQVGTRGGRLSGGQKQRIAIARAIVRQPAVLLLDEATSALDTRSEKVVQTALDQIVSGSGGARRTTVTIAHRLSTIRHAERIAVVESGRVVELGTHDELLALGGVFARLAQGGADAG